jgi:hypothetical protein
MENERGKGRSRQKADTAENARSIFAMLKYLVWREGRGKIVQSTHRFGLGSVGVALFKDGNVI